MVGVFPPAVPGPAQPRPCTCPELGCAFLQEPQPGGLSQKMLPCLRMAPSPDTSWASSRVFLPAVLVCYSQKSLVGSTPCSCQCLGHAY